jgi:carbamoyltransferase
MKRVWSKKYPDSIGLFYTAFTHYLGLKPNEEEYILMGMAAFGKPVLVDDLKKEFFTEFGGPDFKMRHNLHNGCKWWSTPKGVTKFDIAASVQAIMEEYLLLTTKWMRQNLDSRNLVFMGGCALNCVANTEIAIKSGFNKMWVMPNPGDAGSAIGAVAALENRHLNWTGPYLGTNINRVLDIEGIVDELLKGKAVAVANGRAEFGPRALGNRSLLCDPRGPDAKARMNKLKKREEFRPFAPAVLQEHAYQYFNMPMSHIPYMQYVVPCKAPTEFPGICHEDGTSRVQTVNYADNPNFRLLLEHWYEKTGCPMLMNTSLNIKGEPLVNSLDDAKRWEKVNGVKVF